MAADLPLNRVPSKCYIGLTSLRYGVENKAARIKDIYVGVMSDVPVYEEGTKTINITGDNIAEYFTVEDSNYAFKWDSTNSRFAANNLGKNSSTATTKLTALQDITNFSLAYGYKTESNYDKLTIKHNSTTVVNAVSGTGNSTYSKSIAKGDTLTFTYTKDSSQSASGEVCWFGNMAGAVNTKVQTGTVRKSVARKIVRGYVGVREPIYEEKTVYITQDNIADYFEITGAGYEWADENTFRLTCQSGDASAVWTALQDIKELRMNYFLDLDDGDNSTFYSKSSNVWKEIGPASINQSFTEDIVSKNETLNFTLSAIDPSSSSAELSISNISGIAKVQTGVQEKSLARLCWGEPKVWSFKHSVATSLKNIKYALAATSVGDYALFGGGYGINFYDSKVDAYNSSLTHSNPTDLSEGQCDLAAASVGDYALFGGGHNTNGYPNMIDAYNSSLTHSNPTKISEYSYLAAASVGDYALFGGGRDGGSSTNIVNAYNSSLTRSNPTNLSQSRNRLAAASVGDYALFGGGLKSSNTTTFNTVDAYNSSLTRSNPTDLKGYRSDLAAASVGDYALFGGGQVGGSPSSTVDAYNSSLTRSNPTNLSESKQRLAATSMPGNEYVLFGGGNKGNATDNSSIVDVYNFSLTRSNPTNLSKGRSDLAAASVGNYALFGGGSQGVEQDDWLSTVDAYQLT